MRKCREMKAESPEKCILLFERIEYRHLDGRFGKKYFGKRGLIDISKLSERHNELSPMTKHYYINSRAYTFIYFKCPYCCVLFVHVSLFRVMPLWRIKKRMHGICVDCMSLDITIELCPFAWWVFCIVCILKREFEFYPNVHELHVGSAHANWRMHSYAATLTAGASTRIGTRPSLKTREISVDWDEVERNNILLVIFD